MTPKKILFLTMTLLVFGGLCGLGTWQVQRLKWKNNLIATKKEAMKAPPIDLFTAISRLSQNQDVEFNKTKLKGHWIQNTLYYIVGRTYVGQAGYHIVAPFKTGDQKVVFVNLGWSRTKEAVALPTAFTTIEGYIRYPYKNAFTPDPIPEKREWGSVLPEQLRDEIPNEPIVIMDVYVDLMNPCIIPGPHRLKPLQHTIDLPNRHLGYCLTWYSLAIVWLIIMLTRYRKLT